MKNYDVETVYVMCIYCGTQKPKNHNEFLAKLAEKFTDLRNIDCTYNGKVSKLRLGRLFWMDRLNPLN